LKQFCKLYIYSYLWSPVNNDDLDNEDLEDDMWEELADA